MTRVVAHVDAETGFSGGEVQVFLLMEGLRRRGWTNLLLCPPGSRCEAEGRGRGFDVETVPMRNDLALGAVPRLAHALRGHGALLAHLHTGRAHWLGGLAARRVGIPALTTRRMDRVLRRGPWTSILYGLVRRAVAISPAVDALLAAGGVPAPMRRIIPSSVDPEALRPAVARETTRRDAGLGDEDVLLLVLAQITRRKGIDVLLDAFAAVRAPSPRTHLWIAGDGPERAALAAQAASLGLGDAVTFLGPRADKADLLAAADVLVLPSRREGLGIAALEAMAAGRAVLASRVGGLAEAVVHEGTGLLVPPDDASALGDALRRLLTDAALRARLGAAGPERIRAGFHCDHMVDAYDALYGEILAES